jgi:hypothetical protein
MTGSFAIGFAAPVSASTSKDSPLIAVCSLEDVPIAGARVIERPQHPDGNVALFPHRREPRVRRPRSLSAQRRTAVAGHRLRRPRGLSSAQLVDRAWERCRRRARCRLRAHVSGDVERGIVFVALG